MVCPYPGPVCGQICHGLAVQTPWKKENNFKSGSKLLRNKRPKLQREITPILPDSLQLSMFTTIKRHCLLLEKNFQLIMPPRTPLLPSNPGHPYFKQKSDQVQWLFTCIFHFFSFQGTNLLHDRIRGSNELKSPNQPVSEFESHLINPRWTLPDPHIMSATSLSCLSKRSFNNIHNMITSPKKFQKVLDYRGCLI